MKWILLILVFAGLLFVCEGQIHVHLLWFGNIVTVPRRSAPYFIL